MSIKNGIFNVHIENISLSIDDTNIRLTDISTYFVEYEVVGDNIDVFKLISMSNTGNIIELNNSIIFSGSILIQSPFGDILVKPSFKYNIKLIKKDNGEYLLYSLERGRKLRIAFDISGYMRHAEVSMKIMKKAFEDLNPDIFMYVYKNNQVKLRYGLQGKYIDHKEINEKELRNQYPNIKVLKFAEDDVEGHEIIQSKINRCLTILRNIDRNILNNFPRGKDFVDNYESGETWINRFIRYMFNIYRISYLRTKWQKKNNVKYDFVFKWRPDLVITEFNLFEYDKSKIYVCGNETQIEEGFVGDVIYFGNEKYINKINEGLFIHYLENQYTFIKNGYTDIAISPEVMLQVVIKDILKLPKGVVLPLSGNNYHHNHFTENCIKKFGKYCSNCSKILEECIKNKELVDFLTKNQISIYDLNYFSITHTLRCRKCDAFHDIS